MSDPTFTEAPASATLRIEYKGYDILFTLRDSTGTDLLKKLEGAISHFEKMGIKPGHQNGHSTPSGTPGNAPNCPSHNKPMKPGNKGGWYCPVKIADDDGTGKPVYCKQKA